MDKGLFWYGIVKPCQFQSMKDAYGSYHHGGDLWDIVGGDNITVQKDYEVDPAKLTPPDDQNPYLTQIFGHKFGKFEFLSNLSQPR